MGGPVRPSLHPYTEFVPVSLKKVSLGDDLGTSSDIKRRPQYYNLKTRRSVYKDGEFSLEFIILVVRLSRFFTSFSGFM